MPSMASVAREANVAVSTVSLTLNHRHRVKPETRRRIEEAIRRVGYRPRIKPKEPTGGAPIRVAFIYTLDSLHSPDDRSISGYCREIIAGLQEAIAGTSSTLTVFRGVDHVDHDLMVNEQLESGEFDGAVLLGAAPRNGYLERLQQAGLPLVVMNRPPEHGRFSWVTLDYYGGAELAIRHLLSLGHRRIALSMANTTGKWLIDELRHGALDALRAHGLQPAVDDDGPNEQPEHLQRFCQQVIDRRATAIFTGDHAAVCCAQLLTQAGVRVPEEASVIGFDGRGLATEAGRLLTTISYDKRRMGRMAVQILQRLMRSRGKLRWLGGAVSTFLVEGQTAAAHPASAPLPPQP